MTIADWLPAPRIRSPSQCPRDSAVLDLGRPLRDHHHRVDEPTRAMLRRLVRLAAGAPRPQRRLDLAFQAAASLNVDRLINRLRAHPHALVIRMVLADPVADLLRRPSLPQPILNVVLQRAGLGELAGLRPRPCRRRSAVCRMRQIVTVNRMRGELTRDRRRRPVQIPPDRRRRESRPLQIGDLLSLEQRQMPPADGTWDDG